jgi:ribosomal protein S18 acetylase RimI-like enzyme
MLAVAIDGALPEGVTLRPVREEDAEFLFRVYAGTRVEELAVVPWSEEQKEAFLRMQFRAQDTDYHRSYPDAAFLVIESDGAPAGRLYVHRRRNEIAVVDVALVPEYRGRGIGGALLRGLMAEAAAAGLPVRLHVERFNPAQRLYARLGFRPLADHGVYLLMEWRPDVDQVNTAS